MPTEGQVEPTAMAATPPHLPWRGALLVAVLLAALVFPWVFPLPYHRDVMIRLLLYAMLAQAWNILAGYCGQISLGHAVFFGTGAYASTMLQTTWGWNPWLGLVAGILAAVGLSLAIGYPCFRLRGHYFAMATLAFGMIIQIVFANGGTLTGGWTGLSGIPAPTFGPLVVSGSRNYYVLLVVVVWIQYLFIKRMTSGRFGRALRVIRENELAAESIGINAAEYKIKAIFVGCAWAGVAGSLMAHLNSFVSPEPFSFWQSVAMLLMVVVGGVASLPGAVIGALSVTVLDELMRGFTLYRPILYGAMVVLLMIFLPEGLAGLIARLWRGWLGGEAAVKVPSEDEMEPQPETVGVTGQAGVAEELKA